MIYLNDYYFLTENDITNSDNTKLELFDFDKYIETEKLKEVKNSNLISLTDRNSFDPDGIWSEIIFGRVGSKERKTRFGYIVLNIHMIRPVMFKILKTYSEIIRDIINETQKFKLNKDGSLEVNEAGETGLLFLLNNWDKIDFAVQAKKEKKEIGEFINQHRNLIFIKNYWIIPPGSIRDVSISKKNQSFTSEINDIYEKIISLNDQIKLYDFDDEMKSLIVKEMNNFLLQAHAWIQDKMVGKNGLLRGTMLKKRVDYTGRIIASSNAMKIPFGKVGIPWHDLFVLYEPFCFHYILKVKPEIQNTIKQSLNINHNKPLNLSELKKLTTLIQANHNSLPESFINELFECVSYVVKGKDILIKRDPVVGRKSYFSSEPMPLRNDVGIVVNPLVCSRLTLDFDGDQVCAFPVFSKEGLKEAAKLNPTKTKSIWYDIKKYGSHQFNPQLDAVSIIYAATKDYE